MKRKILIAALSLLPQSALACDFPSGWQMMNAQSSSSFEVAAKLPEQPLKTGAQFDIDILVCGKTSVPIRVEIDAIMPAHKHGMNYLPEVSKLNTESFRASGLFFHMPGQWQITADLKGEKTTRFYLDVAAK